MSTVFSRLRQPTAAAMPKPRLLLGRQLLDAGKLTEGDVARIVEAQRTNRLRFGEAAVEMGLLSPVDVEVALARQYNYPCFLPPDTGLHESLYVANQPFGLQSEALRTMRSQLQLRWFNDKRKSVVLTSATGAADSGGLAANLAIAFSQAGERTLLIDANMREPNQHDLFGLDGTRGLATLLNGGCEMEEVLASIPSFEILKVIPAGAIPPNPQELLGQVAFSYLIETAPALFDVVIVDTPPILRFADAHLIASLVGGCVLATHRHRTRIAEVEEIKRQLAGLRCEIVGAVVLD
jgi:protein-tyrosine kinase